MTTPPSPEPAIPGVGPLAHVPPLRKRHPLGLPAGSVRAILALLVLASLWAMTLFGSPALLAEVPLLYLYLQYLMILIIAHFFAAHGNTIRTTPDEHSPLGLPRGFVRFFLLAGTFVGENALLRFYVLHCVFLPVIVTVLIAIHFWRIRKDGGISGPL